MVVMMFIFVKLHAANMAVPAVVDGDGRIKFVRFGDVHGGF